MWRSRLFTHSKSDIMPNSCLDPDSRAWERGKGPGGSDYGRWLAPDSSDVTSRS
jgi:hypothetical protein